MKLTIADARPLERQLRHRSSVEGRRKEKEREREREREREKRRDVLTRFNACPHACVYRGLDDKNHRGSYVRDSAF